MNKLAQHGFDIIPNVFSHHEIEEINGKLDQFSSQTEKRIPIHAIRNVMEIVPELFDLITNKKLRSIVENIFGKNCTLIKSIYFDKPENSNWFVAYHQDLTINVTDKIELAKYSNWTVKNGFYGVQPPQEILKNITTLRIHLDDTNEFNGALKVIPGSHLDGVRRFNGDDINEEVTCEVQAGGVMLMKPLLFHSSSRSQENKRRRVLHLEFTDQKLDEPLNWFEEFQIRNE